ncbi:uncharacterized protein K444DRAFT_638537 [Hyaloscypha bicolor E]|uniref:Uncharacterized protein n=1 Tax=Hyaloscypha bicolor E TaxID=1095630 RepID=A0A2J6SGS2_9HELO|nr:uncharacterized protein K444DRAFT_638537 [Hyaloscypha bicolor E]PMD49958.1 hypothetical protein K444DRAFT_638537 [Hyaloscypha bicolor E]
MSSSEPMWNFSALPEEPIAEHLEQSEEDEAHPINLEAEEVPPQETQAQPGLMDQKTVQWLIDQLNYFGQLVQVIHDEKIPADLNETLQKIMRNTQNLPEMISTLDSLNSRHLLYELGTNVIKTRVQELTDQGKAANVQLSNLFQLQSQIFQGLGKQLTTLLELSERIDRLATGGRNGQRVTLHTAATAPEGSLFSRVMAGCRAIGRFFGSQPLGIFAAIILIAVIVALKMYEMSQGKEL